MFVFEYCDIFFFFICFSCNKKRGESIEGCVFVLCVSDPDFCAFFYVDLVEDVVEGADDEVVAVFWEFNHGSCTDIVDIVESAADFCVFVIFDNWSKCVSVVAPNFCSCCYSFLCPDVYFPVGCPYPEFIV